MRLVQEIRAVLRNRHIKLVSLDLFDTLIFRRCGKPRLVFEQTAHLLAERNFFASDSDFFLSRVWAEEEARKASPFEEVTLEEIYSHITTDPDVRRIAIDVELSVERKQLYIHKVAKEALDYLEYSKVQWVIASDMYLPKWFILEQLERLLERPFAAEQLFVSSDDRLTKTSGSRYLDIIRRFSIDPASLLHIGDNEHSDYKVPSKMGINVLGYRPPNSITQNKRIVSIQVDAVSGDRTTVNGSSKDNHEQDAYFYDLGYSLIGPLIYGTLMCLHRFSVLYKTNLCLSIMREGAIFTECNNIINQLSSKRRESLRLVNFYASRASTFLPKNADVSPPAWLPELSQRINYSFSDFLAEFDAGTLATAEHAPSDPWEAIRKLLEANEGHFTELASRQRTNFRRYFESVCNSESRMILFDFGSGGTINAAIKRAIPDKTFHNFLSVVARRALDKHRATGVSSFLWLADGERYDPFHLSEVFARSPEWLEILLNGENCSTIRYRSDSSGTPILHDGQSQNPPQIFSSLRAGIFNFIHDEFSQVDFVVAPRALEKINALRRGVSNSLVETILFPSLRDSKYLGSLVHADNNGSRSTRSVISRRDLDVLNATDFAGALEILRLRPPGTQERVYWPNGVIFQKFPAARKNLIDLTSKCYSTQDVCRLLVDIVQTREALEAWIFGAGEIGSEVHQKLRDIGVTISGIMDNRVTELKFGQQTQLVVSPSADNLKGANLIVVASYAFRKELVSQLKELNIPDERIVSLP
jgi:FMN phosphatase YigB (HAD superfamily)